jgi:hypothetical protein
VCTSKASKVEKNLARQLYPACVLVKCIVYFCTSKASKVEKNLARQLYPAQAWHDEHCRQVLGVSICTFVLVKRAVEEPKQSLNSVLNDEHCGQVLCVSNCTFVKQVNLRFSACKQVVACLAVDKRALTEP